MDFSKNFFLVKQLSLGNTKAYDFLMDSYYRSLCAYAYNLTKDYDKAEDIVQNVFVQIWIKRKKINPDFYIKNYLYKSVYNEFINQYRKKKPVIYLEKKYMEALDLVIENEQRDFGDLIKLVDAEIDNLPKKCKHIFVLNKKEGLTHTEISEHLGISIKTIEGHITRAFKILSERLDGEFETYFFLLFGFRQELKTKN